MCALEVASFFSWLFENYRKSSSSFSHICLHRIAGNTTGFHNCFLADTPPFLTQKLSLETCFGGEKRAHTPVT